MKRITALLLLTLFVTNANAQAKKDTVANDATPVLSIQDLARIDSLIQRKFSVAQQRDYQEILAFMQKIVTDRVQQYNTINKSAAKKP